MPRLEKMIRRLGEIYLETNPQTEGQKEILQPEQETVFSVVNPVPEPLEPAMLDAVVEKAISREEPKKEERNPLESKNFDSYIQLLNVVMKEKKPFLQKRYALNDLASDLKVPQHHLSYLLNNIFQVRFNDYINQLRIQYLEERLASEDLSHMTMEGLALEAGFSSRITFIRVVQKQTGQNPSTYFKLRIRDETAEV
jgi:AraC-like DNA-binding protein